MTKEQVIIQCIEKGDVNSFKTFLEENIRTPGSLWLSCAFHYILKNAKNEDAFSSFISTLKEFGFDLNTNFFSLSGSHNFRVNSLILAAAKLDSTHISPRFVIKELIRLGADVNGYGQANCTALTAAIVEKNVGSVRALLESGARLNQSGRHGRIPLTLAIDTKNDALIDAVLTHHEITSTPVDNTALLAAIKIRRLDIIKRLIKVGIVQGLDYDGGAFPEGGPIVCAAKVGNIEILKLLLGQGAHITYTGHTNISALEAAAFRGHAHVVFWLLSRFDFEQTQKDISFWTAAQSGHLEVMEVLLCNGVDIETKHLNATALLYASMYGRLNMVRFLLENGANISASTNGHGAISLAAANGHTDIVRLLIERGSDPDCRGANNMTLLMYAVRAKANYDVVELLINEAEADCHAVDNEGHTVLDYANRLPNSPDKDRIIGLLRETMGLNQDAGAGAQN